MYIPNAKLVTFIEKSNPVESFLAFLLLSAVCYVQLSSCPIKFSTDVFAIFVFSNKRGKYGMRLILVKMGNICFLHLAYKNGFFFFKINI